MNANKWIIHFADGSDYTYCGNFDGAVAHAEGWCSELGAYAIEPGEQGAKK